jgi:hypothetical protein
VIRSNLPGWMAEERDMQSIRVMGSALLLGLCLLLPRILLAEPEPSVTPVAASNTGNIQVPIYKSRVLSTRAAVKRISVGNPEIADILITSPRQLYLLGRSLGSTNVLLWDGNNKLIDSLDLEVVHDLSGLKGKLHQLMPNETIEVFSAQGSLVLRGQVSSAAVMDTAVKVAKSYVAQTASVVQGEGEEAKAGPTKSLDIINRGRQPAGHARGQGGGDAAQPGQAPRCAFPGHRFFGQLGSGRVQQRLFVAGRWSGQRWQGAVGAVRLRQLPL